MTEVRPLRVAINGYGRIGRNVVRAWLERGCPDSLQFVAINDLGDAATLAHLTRYDSTHGRLHGAAELDGDELVLAAKGCACPPCATLWAAFLVARR